MWATSPLAALARFFLHSTLYPPPPPADSNEHLTWCTLDDGKHAGEVDGASKA